MGRRDATRYVPVFKRFCREQKEIFRGEKLSIIGLGILIAFITLAIIGPDIRPLWPFSRKLGPVWLCAPRQISISKTLVWPDPLRP